MGEIRLSIPNNLHKELKQIALDKGITLKQLIIDIFEEYTKVRKQNKSKATTEERR